jgi:hypothetical protein
MTTCARDSSASPRCAEPQLAGAENFAVERDERRSPQHGAGSDNRPHRSSVD